MSEKRKVDPSEQWMIILGKSVNMTNRPAKYDETTMAKIKRIIIKLIRGKNE